MAQQNLRIIISGGGTGGHIYPAIAIAEALQAEYPNVEILFVGAEGRMEMTLIPKAGYKVVGLPVAGLQRQLSAIAIWKNIQFPFKLAASMLKARQLMSSFKPDAVVGVGGYASGPVLQMAQWLGIPTLIQEQNSYAGLTNKRLAVKAKKICVAYPDMGAWFPAEKLVFTGNPLRKSLQHHQLPSPGEARRKLGLPASEPPTLLVMGGSLGAASINQAMLLHVHELVAAGYQVYWQTGKRSYEELLVKLGPIPLGLVVAPFIERMDLAYAAATAVVSRAGALSISELALLGKPVILVPSPNVAADHQTKNAIALVKVGAAILVKDQEAKDNLADEALKLLGNPALQDSLSAAIKKLAKPNAAHDVAQAVMALVKA